MLLLYFWSALVGFGGAILAIFSGGWVLVGLVFAGAVIGVLLLVVPRLKARRRTTRQRRELQVREQAKHAAATIIAAHSQPPAAQSANGVSRRPEGDLSRPSAL